MDIHMDVYEWILRPELSMSPTLTKLQSIDRYRERSEETGAHRLSELHLRERKSSIIKMEWRLPQNKIEELKKTPLKLII